MDKVKQLVWAKEFILWDIFELIENTQRDLDSLKLKAEYMKIIINEAVDEIATSRS